MNPAPPPFPVEGGLTGAEIRARDWSGHPLGRPETWPDALRLTVQLVLSSPESMYLAWGPGLHLFFNDAYRPILGPRLPGAVGTPLPALWPDAWPQIRPLVEKALAGEASRFDDLPIGVDHDGRTEFTWWSFSYAPLRDATGAVAGVLCVTNETTRRVRADRALRDLNASLGRRVEERTAERDRIWRTSRDLLGVADGAGVWLSVSPAWTRVLGWAEEEIVGRTSEWLEHPEDRDRTRAEVARLASGRTTSVFENRFRHRDGSYRALSWTAVPEEGRFYCTARDVTGEHAKAAAMEQVEEALRQSQKMEAVGQLTGGVAHDFNNLLTIIRSSVDFLRRDDLPEERRRRYVEAVSDTVDRAARLTGQLLAFARRQPLKPEVFDVGARVEAVAELVRPLVGGRIRMEVLRAPVPVFTEADASQFETALVNLAANARDAMAGEGRLTFSVGASDGIPPLRAEGPRRGPFVTVTVTDTGQGIPPDRVGRIFEPFYTTKEVGQGTGLGLSQVFGFASQSGGDVHVVSHPGEGAAFVLYLPSAAAPAAAAEPAREPAPRDGGGSILVVEDNEGVGRFSTELLQDLGYRTTWAVDAASALDLLAEDAARFDLVFTDVVMPGMNGVELARLVRARYPALPVVLTSGYSAVLAQERPPGLEFVQKPYSVQTLSLAIGRALAGAARDRG